MTARPVLFLQSSADLYGADQQLLAVAGGLDRDRFLPIAVLPERGELAPLLEEAGVEVAIHPLAVLRREVLRSPASAAALPWRSLRDVRPLARLARERGAAIVHSNTSVVMAGQAVARRAGARHVMHVREIYAGAGGHGARLLWPLMRRRIERADAVVCISEAVAAQFRDPTVIHDGLPRVPEPADRETARAALGVPDGAFAVALVGRLSDWKGQRELAAAIAGSDMIALLAGDPFRGNEWIEEELAGSDGVKLLGFRGDVGTVLGAADAVAVPSTRPEPLGLVALEAGAAGLPVVAAAHGGLTEIVRDGETGILVPPGDRAALAEALRRLAGDPALRARMGEAGARDVRERFSLERMLGEIQELYERLLSRD